MNSNGSNGPRPIRGPFSLIGLQIVALAALGIASWIFVRLDDRDLVAQSQPRIEGPDRTQARAVHDGVVFSRSIQDVSSAQEEGEQSSFQYISSNLHSIAFESDDVKREELLSKVLEESAYLDPRPILLWLKDAEPREIADELAHRVVRLWSERDARAAAAWAMELAEHDFRNRMIADIAVVWVTRNPAEAIQWVRELPIGDVRLIALRGVAGEAVRTQPIEVLRLAQELPIGADRDELMRRGAIEWASRDVSSSVQWARNLQSGSLRENVLAGIAVTWAETDPRAAAILAVDELPLGRGQMDAIVSIAQRWAQQNPAEAAAWVEQFPNSDLKWTIAENVANQWKNQDPHRAEEWRELMAVLPDPEECVEPTPAGPLPKP